MVAVGVVVGGGGGMGVPGFPSVVRVGRARVVRCVVVGVVRGVGSVGVAYGEGAAEVVDLVGELAA
ncbi:hypothetical protein GCM10018966_053430 [Streptomyces yanii]